MHADTRSYTQRKGTYNAFTMFLSFFFSFFFSRIKTSFLAFRLRLDSAVVRNARWSPRSRVSFSGGCTRACNVGVQPRRTRIGDGGSRCLFRIYPFNWISRFGTPAIAHCARLVTQIIPKPSKYGPRIVSTAAPPAETKYPYPTYLPLSRRASNRSALSRAAIQSEWFIATLTRRTGHRIVQRAPLPSRRGRVCPYALCFVLLTAEAPLSLSRSR